MGHFGRLTKVSDLPSKRVLAGLVKKAAQLNDQGIKVARVKKAGPAKPVALPADLAAALKKKAKARSGYDALSPSHKREYIEWITEAKTDETRARRAGAGDRMDGRREVAQLEVRETGVGSGIRD